MQGSKGASKGVLNLESYRELPSRTQAAWVPATRLAGPLVPDARSAAFAVASLETSDRDRIERYGRKHTNYQSCQFGHPQLG